METETTAGAAVLLTVPGTSPTSPGGGNSHFPPLSPFQGLSVASSFFPPHTYPTLLVTEKQMSDVLPMSLDVFSVLNIMSSPSLRCPVPLAVRKSKPPSGLLPCRLRAPSPSRSHV